MNSHKGGWRRKKRFFLRQPRNHCWGAFPRSSRTSPPQQQAEIASGYGAYSCERASPGIGAASTAADVPSIIAANVTVKTFFIVNHLPIVIKKIRLSDFGKTDFSFLIKWELFDCRESLLQIPEDVVDMLGADGQANRAGGDAAFEKLLLGHLGMRRGGRMDN